MKRYIRIFIFTIIVIMMLSGCSNNVEDTPITEQVVSEAVFESETEDAEVVEDWYFDDGTLYVNKIYYTVVEIAGHNRCIYEEPWIEYRNQNQIKRIVINADMVYTTESNITGKPYENVVSNSEPFAGDGPLFGNMDALERITVEYLNLDQITDISYMFGGNSNLRQIDILEMWTSKITNASYLFHGDSSLTSIDLNQLLTSNLVNVEHMFGGCTNLTYVAVDSWDTSKVTNFSHVFDGCSSLTSINLSGWTINEANVAAMFANCDLLNSITLYDVNLLNTISANCMFDDNNSIVSYMFAEDWNIRVEKSGQVWPIPGNCYEAYIIGESTTGIYSACVYYSKLMPTWYEESVEYRQNLDEFTKIQDTEQFDIYLMQDDVELDVSVSDVTGVILDCLSEMTPADDSEQTTMISNSITKLEIIDELAGMKDIDDVPPDIFIELMDMRTEEISIILEEEE